MMGRQAWRIWLWLGVLSLGVAHGVQAQMSTAMVNTHSGVLQVPVKNWKTLRDAQVVKQDLDYSCGAASLAPLLNYFYGQDLTEEALLKAMDKGDGRASFEDMAKAIPQFGFRAQGFAASWEQLTRLKMPVIVYVKHRKNDHFSVLRGINQDTVWLADPSLGNRTYSRQQFLAMWQTRQDSENADLSGKFLAILPMQAEAKQVGIFFTKTPVRHTGMALQMLAHQRQSN